MRAAAATVLSLLLIQAQPAYVREGNRVQQQFHDYRDRLTQFFEELRLVIQRDLSADDASTLLKQLEKAPPPVGVYGYKMLPRIIDIPQPLTPIRSFAYSWPITETYIRSEDVRLDKARSDLRRVDSSERSEKAARLAEIVSQYRELLRNQGTVDQYIEYNRFWQRWIADDRRHYDRMTQVYRVLKAGAPDTAATIREVLGKP